MRHVLLLTLAASAALAGEPCIEDGVLVFPAPGAVVPTNVQFFLEGAGAEQTRVSDLVTSKDAIVLTSAHDEPIQVKAEKGFLSQMKRVAVRLKPMKPLKPDTEYKLELGKTLSSARVINDALGDNSIRWTTGPGADKAAPKFISKPAVSEGFYRKNDKEGLVRYLKIRTVIEETAPSYLLVTMQRVRGSSVRQQYPVPIDGDAAMVGHDGCSGTFGFDDGRAYKLTFELFDSAGNKSTEKVTLELSAPKPL